MDNTKIKKQLKKFEEYLIVDKGLGKVTAEGYCRGMSISLRRMRKYKPKYEDVKKHILWMHEKKYSYSHIVNTSIALEHYTSYKENPVKLGRPKKPRRIIKNTLTEAEVSSLLSATGSDVRKKSIVALLAFSGIRNSELCNLKVEDVDLGTNMLRVIGGKNTKDRLINISTDCARLLIDYLRLYPRTEEQYFFTTLKKRKSACNRRFEKNFKGVN